MSRTFSVHMHTTASATVTVVIADEELAKHAENLGVKVDELTTDDLREVADELAHTRVGPPSICAQCVGWNQPQSLDLGDWETDDDSTYGDTTWYAVEEVTE